MRILHVNKFLYRRGGAESYMLGLADHQRSAGHEVAFFGMRHPDNDLHPYAWAFPPEVEFEPPPPGAVGKLRAAGRMLYSPAARRGMQAVVDDFRPDVVHLHNIYHQLSPSVLAPLARRRIPAVMTLHDMKLVCPTYLFLDKGEVCEACLGRRFHNAPLRRCKDGSLAASAMAAAELSLHTATGAYGAIGRFICPSQFLEGKMRAGGVYPDRLRVIGNFVEPGAEPSAAIDPTLVACAGRLSHEKGVDVLIDAVGRLGGRARLVVAGDGPQRGALEAQADAVAPGRVRFLGRVPRDAVRSLLEEAAVVAVPSRCHENQPLIVLEAYAAGTPVVATTLGGLPELVTPGVTGEVVAHNDAAAMADALSGLLRDAGRASAAGEAGRALVLRDHQPEHHMALVHQVYREAAEHAGRRAPRWRPRAGTDEQESACALR